jgi:hypothetical protein
MVKGADEKAGEGRGIVLLGHGGVIYESILRMDSSDYTLHRHNVGPRGLGGFFRVECVNPSPSVTPPVGNWARRTSNDTEIAPFLYENVFDDPD